MQFATPLIEGVLVERQKRDLADVRLVNGRLVTAQSPNTGALKGCSEPDMRVWLKDTGDPGRKHPLAWEIVEAKPGVLVDINPCSASELVREGIEQGVVSELQGYLRLQPEAGACSVNGMLDLLLEGSPGERCYIEVKNVTLEEDGVALFPDSANQRATKHLYQLALSLREGNRAVVFFCVQRGDVSEVRPADGIDPEFGRALRKVAKEGVEVLAYSTEVTTEGLVLGQQLPVVLD